MKSILTMMTAAVFAATLSVPAFAQVGAGIAGNATVGEKPAPMGANPDIANSDRTQTESWAPKDAHPPMPPTKHADTHSKVVESDRNNGVGVNAGVNPSEGSVGANAHANTATDNSPTGGY